MKSLKAIRNNVVSILNEFPYEEGSYDAWAIDTDYEWTVLLLGLKMPGAVIDWNLDDGGCRSGLRIALPNGAFHTIPDPFDDIDECAETLYELQKKYGRACRAALRAFERVLARQEAKAT